MMLKRINSAYICIALAGILVFLGFGILEAQGQQAGYAINVQNSSYQPGNMATVTWNAPANTSSTDWIGLYRVGTDNRAYLAWKFITGPSGNTTFQVPNDVGQYEFRYFTNNTFNVAASTGVFTVGTGTSTGSYTVQASPTNPAPGADITVTWTAPSGANIQNDWVGVYRIGDVNQAFKDWKYVSGNTGSVTLKVPNESGTYEVRYLKNNAFTSVAKSSAITIGSGGNPSNYTVSITSGNTTPGSTVTFTWTAPTFNNTDWVGLYRAGTDARNYLDWTYVNAQTGSANLRLPNQSGQYVVRYFTNNSFTQVAESAAITVQNNGTGTSTGNYFVSVSPSNVTPGTVVNISFAAPGNTNNSQDWVGIFRAGAGNNAYLDWSYVNTTNTSLSLRAPSQPGTYEVRYLKNNGYTSVATSQQFTVGNGGGGNTGDYTLSVSPITVAPGGLITINWNSPGGANISQDWISIYRVGAANNSYGDWKYVSVGTGSLTLTAPNQPGTYEIRYLKNNGYTSVATSQQITVGSGGNPGGGNSGGYTVTLAPVGANNTVTVSWTAPSSANINQDWIGVFPVGSADTQYVDWSYVNTQTGTISLQLPSTPGVYEVRYFKNNGYTKVASSQTTIVFGVRNYPSSGQSVIAFGDSLVAGVGATSGNDFPSLLTQRLGRQVVNAGVSGDTTALALARLERDVLSRNPKTVIVLLGGNDFLQGIPRTETFANIQTIVNRIQDRGAIVVLVGIDGVINYEAIARATGAAYVPDILDDILGRPALTSDGVHPNNQGYVLVANRIYPTVQALI